MKKQKSFRTVEVDVSNDPPLNFAKKNTSSQGPVLGMQHTFDRLKRTKRGKGRYYCCALGFPALLGPVAVVPTQSKMKALEIQSRCDCNQWFQICRTPAHLKLMASCYDLGYCHTKDCNMTADVPVRTSHLFWVHDRIPQISCSLLAQTSAPWTSSGGIATAYHERSCESLWIWLFLAVRCLHFRDGWCLKCHAVMQETGETATKIKQQKELPKHWGRWGPDRSITRHNAGGLQLSICLKLGICPHLHCISGISLLVNVGFKFIIPCNLSCQPWVGHTDGSHPNAARVFATQNMVVLVTGEFQVMIAFHLESWSQNRQEFCREPM